jgi:hypothetical protein
LQTGFARLRPPPGSRRKASDGPPSLGTDGGNNETPPTMDGVLQRLEEGGALRGKRRTLARPAIARQGEAGEPCEHHDPGGGFRRRNNVESEAIIRGGRPRHPRTNGVFAACRLPETFSATGQSCANGAASARPASRSRASRPKKRHSRRNSRSFARGPATATARPKRDKPFRSRR